MKDLAQDSAGDMLGAAKDWSVKVYIVVPPPRCLGRHVKDEHIQDAAQDVAQDVVQDVAKNVLGAAEDGKA